MRRVAVGWHVLRIGSLSGRHGIGHVNSRETPEIAATATDVHPVAALQVGIAGASKADDLGASDHLYRQLTSTYPQRHTAVDGRAQHRPHMAETPRASVRTLKPSSPTHREAMERMVGEHRKETGSEVDRVLAGNSLASDRQSRRHVRDPSDGHRLVIVIGRTGGHDPPSEDAPMPHLHRKAEVQSLVPT
jgi:ketosteroid isomerase-like protein